MEILYIPTNPVQCGIFCIKKEVFSTSSFKWWALRGSNSRHLPCKGSALPTELNARIYFVQKLYIKKKFMSTFFLCFFYSLINHCTITISIFLSCFSIGKFSITSSFAIQTRVFASVWVNNLS